MDNKLNLAIFFGGKSGEHEVSLMSARSVLSALDPDKYNIYQVGITYEGSWKTGNEALNAFETGSEANLREAVLSRDGANTILCARELDRLEPIAEIDVIFPILHGTFGEDGTIQGLFEIFGCAYVGAGVVGSSVAMDKAICKHVAKSVSIPVLEYQVFTRGQIEQHLREVINLSEKIAPYPLFVKPANLGSSVGINKANNRAQLENALLVAARYDRRVLVERGINAREIEISVLGNDQPICSVPGEIIPGDEFYTYEDKYHHGDPEIAIPAPLSEELTNQLQQFALKAYQAVDVAGMARVDFLIEKESGKLYFNEINTIPGFTRISMYPKLWKYSGLDYSALVDRLIDLALERKAEQDATIRRFEV